MTGDKPRQIAVKAMCLIEHNRKLLLNKGYDKLKKQTFYRLIGGKVEFGEKSIDSIKREIKEELDSNIENLKFITVEEEIFTYEGNEGHEVVFLYTGNVLDNKILDEKLIPNPDSEEFPAVWVPTSDVLEKKIILYPSSNYKKILLELRS